MAIKLPNQQTSDRQLNTFQTALSSALQPITSNPIAACTILSNVTLTAGQTTPVPIGLSQPLIGWFIVRLRGNALIWDSQDSNTTPSQNLLLNTTATVIADIAIF